MNATRTIIAHFATAPDSLEKARKEFRSFIQQKESSRTFGSEEPKVISSKSSLKDYLRAKVTLDIC